MVTLFIGGPAGYRAAVGFHWLDKFVFDMFVFDKFVSQVKLVPKSNPPSSRGDMSACAGIVLSAKVPPSSSSLSESAPNWNMFS
jgi:hypothetical protein